MTPDRWRRVTSIFHAARARESGDRLAFLDAACGGDASLKADVESLLDAEDGSLGDAMIASGPSLTPGTAFGQYRIDALIGAGGMGQLYRATDTRLRRAVALKVLMPELLLDPSSASRFEREAHTLASLNHPNIASIYGVEDVSGVRGLVLELVDGPTLSERLRAGPLPPLDALLISRQIASALEAAHERGIVHRDLKPANVKVTPAGTVKVLDFGIAKLRTPDAGLRNLDLPTATRTGVILGTPAYMSPEHAAGQPIDKRTDIWAFGCVLFEMLTGRGAFAADSAAGSVARVIERDPDWNTLPSSVPDPIRRLVKRCLQKNPTNRLRDISDARIEIDEQIATFGQNDEAAPRPVARPRTMSWLAVAAVLALVAAAAIWWRPFAASSSSAPVGQAMELGVTFPNNYMPTDGIAISPDGRRIAANVWSGRGDIWMQSLDGSRPRPLPGAEGGAFPFWKPDSSTLAFFQSGQIVYWAPPGGILSTELVLTDEDIRVGQTKTLLSQPVLTLIDARTAYDITRDGQRILARQLAGPPTPGIRVIVNWMAKLK